MDNSRKTGLEIVGDVPWGTHFCQFYKTKNDLTDILVPYFKAGLENNEFCMWVTAQPLDKEDAISALRKSYPSLDEKINNGQIEFLSYEEWYKIDGVFDADRVLAGWVQRLEKALKNGYEGLRLTGNTFFLEKEDWSGFTSYEEKVNNVIGNYKMLAMCTYSIDKCGPNEIIDVMSNHQFALIRRESKWSVIENSTSRHLEKAVQESEEKYRLLFARMLDGFAFHKIILDKDNKPVDYVFLEINSAFEKLTGLKKEDIIGKKVTDVLPGIENDPADWIGRYGRVSLTGEKAKFESYAKNLDKWYSISAYSPEKEYFVTLFQDITERKRAEDALKENEIELKTAQRVSQMGSWNLDIATNKLLWSDEVYRIFEIDKADFGASYETFLSFIHPDDRDKVNKAYSDSLKNKTSYDIVHRLKLLNGRIKFVREICETKYDDLGKPVKSIGAVQDITEQRMAEEVLKRDKETFEKLVNDRTNELINAQLELSKSKRLSDIGTLAATVAHELRNPLGVIRTAVYNIKRKSQGLPLESHINNIEKKISESDQIINNLLSYSRIKMPHYEKVKIYYLIDECITFAKERFENKNISFLKEIEPIREISVDIDPFQMREVFNNIVDNACHAVEPVKGRITVSASLSRDGRLDISFKDNGTGISKEDLNKIFEPFFTRKSKGTGLGLTICKELVDLHGGKLKIDSVENKGTKVTVSIPLKKEMA
ncbi:MAG: MEDS domain-containing protein [Elusimicrobia bacterium]|nr:MEDS domain-containing protein [Candidatus Liberimonas magnetica]